MQALAAIPEAAIPEEGWHHAVQAGAATTEAGHFVSVGFGLVAWFRWLGRLLVGLVSWFVAGLVDVLCWLDVFVGVHCLVGFVCLGWLLGWQAHSAVLIELVAKMKMLEHILAELAAAQLAQAGCWELVCLLVISFVGVTGWCFFCWSGPPGR